MCERAGEEGPRHGTAGAAGHFVGPQPPNPYFHPCRPHRPHRHTHISSVRGGAAIASSPPSRCVVHIIRSFSGFSTFPFHCPHTTRRLIRAGSASAIIPSPLRSLLLPPPTSFPLLRPRQFNKLALTECPATTTLAAPPVFPLAFHGPSRLRSRRFAPRRAPAPPFCSAPVVGPGRWLLQEAPRRRRNVSSWSLSRQSRGPLSDCERETARARCGARARRANLRA